MRSKALVITTIIHTITFMLAIFILTGCNAPTSPSESEVAPAPVKAAGTAEAKGEESAAPQDAPAANVQKKCPFADAANCPHRGDDGSCNCPKAQDGDCPHAKDGGCPHKKDGGCPHAKQAGCPHKNNGGCPHAKAESFSPSKDVGCPHAQ